MASKIRGQIITRPMGKESDKSSRVRVMVFGIIAVDESSFLNKEGMQFIVSENQFADLLGVGLSTGAELIIHKDGAIDRSEMTKGNTPNYMLTEGIWRT